MSDDQTTRASESSLVAYLLALLFACVCLAILISQRLQIAYCGRSITRLHGESVELRAQQCRLRLRVAERTSYENLLKCGKRMQIKLVPPEEAAGAFLAARYRQGGSQ